MAGPFGGIVSGMAAGGAGEALERVLTRRLQEQNLLQQLMAEQERARLEQQRITQQGQYQTASLDEMRGVRQAQEAQAQSVAAKNKADMERQAADEAAFAQWLAAQPPDVQQAAQYRRFLK